MINKPLNVSYLLLVTGSLLIFASLLGCGRCQRTITQWTGDLTYKCSRSGVEYVQSDSGIAVHVDRDGRPVSCQ